MKTLLIKYLPSGEQSNTKKLLNLFLQELKNIQIQELDLLKASIPIFNETSLAAYSKRNYMNQSLTETEARSLSQQDQLIAQIKAVDILVMAYPMHNFGMPGIVKSYLDSILFNGETFAYGKKLMAGKKVLTLFTSGGLYPQDYASVEYPHWDTLTQTSKINFNFMGFDEVEVLGTSLRDPKQAEARLQELQEKIRALTQRWYKN